MPVSNDPKTPQIMVMPPSPEIYELVNPFGSNITLKTEPKPMNVSSSIANTAAKNIKSLFFTTYLIVTPRFCCFGFLRLTRLGACSGSDRMTSINPKVITVTM